MTIFRVRRIRTFALGVLAAFGLWSHAQPTMAETAVMAREYSETLPYAAPGNRCFTIYARLGWQRVPARKLDPVDLMFLDKDTNALARQFGFPEVEGWSVDGARYAKVGISGHVGADGDALEPFAAFKYTQNAPFGQLLIRNADGDVWINNAKRVQIGASRYFDFRINDKDSGLGDNDGYILACPIHRDSGKG